MATYDTPNFLAAIMGGQQQSSQNSDMQMVMQAMSMATNNAIAREKLALEDKMSLRQEALHRDISNDEIKSRENIAKWGNTAQENIAKWENTTRENIAKWGNESGKEVARMNNLSAIVKDENQKSLKKLVENELKKTISTNEGGNAFNFDLDIDRMKKYLSESFSPDLKKWEKRINDPNIIEKFSSWRKNVMLDGGDDAFQKFLSTDHINEGEAMQYINMEKEDLIKIYGRDKVEEAEKKTANKLGYAKIKDYLSTRTIDDFNKVGGNVKNLIFPIMAEFEYNLKNLTQGNMLKDFLPQVEDKRFTTDEAYKFMKENASTILSLYPGMKGYMSASLGKAAKFNSLFKHTPDYIGEILTNSGVPITKYNDYYESADQLNELNDTFHNLRIRNEGFELAKQTKQINGE